MVFISHRREGIQGNVFKNVLKNLIVNCYRSQNIRNGRKKGCKCCCIRG